MKGVDFACWKEFCEEHSGTVFPSVHNTLVRIEQFFHPPEQGKQK
jgi:hypothetical protein